MSRFNFIEAIIIEKDFVREIDEIQHSKHIRVSDDSCWSLLESCLYKLPIRKTYHLLDELYGTRELSFPEGTEFVVESIRGRSVNKGQTYYYVKWKGWPPIFNTWEPESNLIDCEEAIKAYLSASSADFGMLPPEPQPDKRVQIQEVMDRLREATPCSVISPYGLLQRFLELQPRSSGNLRIYKQPQYLNLEHQYSDQFADVKLKAVSLKRPASDSDFVPVASKRVRLSKKDKQVLELALQVFEQKLNSVYSNEARITVENNVDSECPPVDFQPIPDYRPGQGVFLPDKSPIGCECCLNPDAMSNVCVDNATPLEPCWENRKRHCCAATAGELPPYNRLKRLVAPVGHPVYECNSSCKCGPGCPFRVVQLGRRIPLCVFRTRDRGWGVKTKAAISKGTFVAEYLGEVITFDDAEKRGLIYDKQTMTYLFDLDFEGDAHYTVDASQMGNISHFFNHSCDPNLTVRCVFIECLDTKLPRIALYASRFIRKDEELTFDYNMTGAINNVNEPPSVEDGIERAITESVDSVSSIQKSPSPSQSSTEFIQDTGSEVSYDSKSISSKGPRMKCLCRSKNCRGYLVH